jgi:hypothetical protein
MKTKITFLKKAASLCCLLIFLSFSSKYCAQIVYTDIVPDASISTSYPLDLNNDAIVDFYISIGQFAVKCSPQNSNAYAGDSIAGLSSPWPFAPWALSPSDTICASLATWYDSNNSGAMVGLGISAGYWQGVTNKYLALKLIVGSNTYYGWARLDFINTTTTGTFTIKDYAYNSTPNACIQAGQNILGINKDISKHVFSTFPNPFISSTTIQTADPLREATLTICNSYGQVVKQVKNISGQTISLSRDHLPSGMYFAQLIEENKIIAVEKIIITD